MKKRVYVLFAQQEAFPHSEVLLSSCLTGSKTSVFSGVTNAQSMWMSVSVTVSIAHCYTHNVFLPAMPKHFRHHWPASNAWVFVCPFFCAWKKKKQRNRFLCICCMPSNQQSKSFKNERIRGRARTQWLNETGMREVSWSKSEDLCICLWKNCVRSDTKEENTFINFRLSRHQCFSTATVFGNSHIIEEFEIN